VRGAVAHGDQSLNLARNLRGQRLRRPIWDPIELRCLLHRSGRQSGAGPDPVDHQVRFRISGDRHNSWCFPTIDGSEFAFTFDPDGTGIGSWTYTPGPGDPMITAFVAKGRSGFNLFASSGNTGS
jgi:hypothetical protein